MTETAFATSVLGRTGLEVTNLCIGTAAWGETSPDHGVSVPEEQAIEAALAVFNGPLNYLDTSNNYGKGEAERRIGVAIARNGGLPDGFVLQTKVDRDPVTGAHDAARMRASLEESLTRLGLDRVPVLLLHDPEHFGFDASMEPGGAVDTLVALRDEGYCDILGVGGAPVSMMRQFVATDIFDVILTHNRFTLLDRSAEILIQEAADRNLGVLNGAVFAGGVLAQYPRTSDLYGYGKAHPAILERIDAMGKACADAGVALIDAALQFSMRDTRIHSTVCGVESAQQLERLLQSATAQIPAEVWDELNTLCPPSDSWHHD